MNPFTNNNNIRDEKRRNSNFSEHNYGNNKNIYEKSDVGSHDFNAKESNEIAKVLNFII